MIADALEEYFGDQPMIYLKKSLASYAEMGKDGVSVLADLGAYSHRYACIIERILINSRRSNNKS